MHRSLEQNQKQTHTKTLKRFLTRLKKLLIGGKTAFPTNGIEAIGQNRQKERESKKDRKKDQKDKELSPKFYTLHKN